MIIRRDNLQHTYTKKSHAYINIAKMTKRKDDLTIFIGYFLLNYEIKTVVFQSIGQFVHYRLFPLSNVKMSINLNCFINLNEIRSFHDNLLKLNLFSDRLY